MKPQSFNIIDDCWKDLARYPCWEHQERSQRAQKDTLENCCDLWKRIKISDQYEKEYRIPIWVKAVRTIQFLGYSKAHSQNSSVYRSNDEIASQSLGLTWNIVSNVQ